MTSKYLNLRMLQRCLIMAVLSTIFSYPSFAGGDHYEIYLDKKLITKQLVTQSASDLHLRLDRANYNEKLIIYYSHCGVTGKERSLVLKDGKGKLLREWKFDHGTDAAAMSIPVKEILDLNLSGNNFTLYYTSKELPNGRVLTAINLNNKNTAGYKNAQTANDQTISTGLNFFTRMFV